MFSKNSSSNDTASQAKRPILDDAACVKALEKPFTLNVSTDKLDEKKCAEVISHMQSATKEQSLAAPAILRLATKYKDQEPRLTTVPKKPYVGDYNSSEYPVFAVFANFICPMAANCHFSLPTFENANSYRASEKDWLNAAYVFTMAACMLAQYSAPLPDKYDTYRHSPVAEYLNYAIACLNKGNGYKLWKYHLGRAGGTVQDDSDAAYKLSVAMLAEIWSQYDETRYLTPATFKDNPKSELAVKMTKLVNMPEKVLSDIGIKMPKTPAPLKVDTDSIVSSLRGLYSKMGAKEMPLPKNENEYIVQYAEEYLSTFQTLPAHTFEHTLRDISGYKQTQIFLKYLPKCDIDYAYGYKVIEQFFPSKDKYYEYVVANAHKIKDFYDLWKDLPEKTRAILRANPVVMKAVYSHIASLEQNCYEIEKLVKSDFLTENECKDFIMEKAQKFITKVITPSIEFQIKVHRSVNKDTNLTPLDYSRMDDYLFDKLLAALKPGVKRELLTKMIALCGYDPKLETTKRVLLESYWAKHIGGHAPDVKKASVREYYKARYSSFNQLPNNLFAPALFKTQQESNPQKSDNRLTYKR